MNKVTGAGARQPSCRIQDTDDLQFCSDLQRKGVLGNWLLTLSFFFEFPAIPPKLYE